MTRILFVDDEVYLLEALKRILRKKNEEWDMTFAKSGKEAIELLNNNSFDIIVTDYKMPEMDGLELLTIVKEKFTDMKRIILSGQSESETHNKAKEVANIYLSKPCEPDSLIKVLKELSNK